MGYEELEHQHQSGAYRGPAHSLPTPVDPMPAAPSALANRRGTARLLGLGTANPPYPTKQGDIHRFMERVLEETVDPKRTRAAKRMLSRIYALSAIERRHCSMADYGETDPEEFEFYPANWGLDPFPTTAERMQRYQVVSLEIAQRAAEAALEQAKQAVPDLERESITHVIIATCTGFYAPGPDVLLLERLGLPMTVQRFVVGFMGCYATFNALQLADTIVRSDPSARVLVITVELCTLHFQLGTVTETMVANTLFADGAAAYVFGHADTVGPEAGIAGLLAGHSDVPAGTLEQMSWKVGDHGFRMTLSQDVPRTLRAGAPAFVEALLAKADRGRDEVAGWAVHPGGRAIVEATAESLHMEPDGPETSFSTLNDFGNMSSATIGFVLEREFAKRADRSGPIVALGFGPGLTMEGIVFI